MPSHIGSYDGKRDPDNFFYLFEGAIRMQKWLIQQKKFTKTHLAVCNIKQREGESTRAFATRYTDDTLQILGLYKGSDGKKPTHGSKQERWKLMKLQVIEGKTSKDQRRPHGIITEDRKARTGSPPTEDLIMDCFLAFPKAQKRFLLPKRASKVDLKVPLIGFLGEKSYSSGEIPLEITIGRTAMQKMGIVVSTIHGAIKFYTTIGIRTVFSSYESNKIKEGMKKGLGPDRNTATCKEVEELTKAEILRKVKHQTWVSNPVMVKKSDGGWRMCVDFMDINKACPKYCYPLPEIDWKVESLSGFRLKFLLDTYKGYHQIQMAEGDEDKTTFFAGKGVFCYQKMPFGLKNAGATYQILVDKVFHDQIGRNLEAYVDDMVIKSTSEEDMLVDIKETLEKFRSINMKLNPKKCSFGVEEGPFLGHLITKQGIRASPSKVKAITDIEQPKTLKDIQSLNGKLAALSHFLSKSR
ncbi:reverse transcriptase domain-containing protein [Tanacetum coccineum]